MGFIVLAVFAGVSLVAGGPALFAGLSLALGKDRSGRVRALGWALALLSPSPRPSNSCWKAEQKSTSETRKVIRRRA